MKVKNIVIYSNIIIYLLSIGARLCGIAAKSGVPMSFREKHRLRFGAVGTAKRRASERFS